MGLSGCHLVSSCSNIYEREQFRTMLDYNFERHYGNNRAPLSLSFDTAWLKVNKGFTKEFAEWKEKCDIKGQAYCSLPNACPLTTRELPGEVLRLHTCVECPNNYPWLLDPTGDGFNFK